MAQQYEKPRQVVNVSEEPCRFQIATMAGAPPRRYDLKPGEVIELEPGYALRRQASPDRDLQPSIIEMLTGGSVLPIGDQRAKDAIQRRELGRASAAAPAPKAEAPKEKR